MDGGLLVHGWKTIFEVMVPIPPFRKQMNVTLLSTIIKGGVMIWLWSWKNWLCYMLSVSNLLLFFYPLPPAIIFLWVLREGKILLRKRNTLPQMNTLKIQCIFSKKGISIVKYEYVVTKMLSFCFYWSLMFFVSLKLQRELHMRLAMLDDTFMLFSVQQDVPGGLWTVETWLRGLPGRGWPALFW